MTTVNEPGDNSETLLDIASLNDIDLSTVDDVPEFIDPPAGNYILRMHSAKIEKYEKNEIEKTRIRHIYAVVTTIELAKKDELICPDGSLFSETFLANQEGLKYWKAKAKSILGDLGQAKVGEVLAELSNQPQFSAQVSLKTVVDAVDKNKTYTNVRVKVLGNVAGSETVSTVVS